MWWTLSFFLTTLAAVLSLFDLYNRATSPSPEVYLAVASWPVGCLLLACAIRGEKWVVIEEPEDETLTRPLLESNGGIEVSNEVETFYATANVISRLIFRWLDPLLAIGYKRPLELRDVPHLSSELGAATANERFLRAWDAQKENQSVFRALFSVYWKPMFLNGLCALGKCLTLVFGPIILQLFIRYESGERLFEYEGITLVGALFASKLLESVFQRHWYAGARMVGMELRSGLIATIYQKQLRYYPSFPFTVKSAVSY